MLLHEKRESLHVAEVDVAVAVIHAEKRVVGRPFQFSAGGAGGELGECLLRDLGGGIECHGAVSVGIGLRGT